MGTGVVVLEEIQAITDSLAADLRRSVFTEDAWYRPLAASAQLGAVDEPRVRALLLREPTAEHLGYFRDLGVPSTREPLRVPASAASGLLPRVVVPVLSGDRQLARLWLIDAEPPVSSEDIARARRAGDEIRAVLLRRRSSVHQRLSAGGGWLAKAESAGASQRRSSVERIRDSFGMGPLERLRTCVIRTDGGADLEDYLDDLMERFDVRGCVGRVRDDHLLVLTSVETTAEAACQKLTAAANQVAARHDIAVVAVGLGGPLPGADQVRTSIDQAVFSARVAARVPEMAGQACWETLGEYRLFYACEWTREGVAAIDPGVAALLDQERMLLVQTVLAYLDRQGDVNATAAALNVHRTTLYYRLNQARDILGSDLTGPGRFRIHAALRLARLAGL